MSTNIRDQILRELNGFRIPECRAALEQDLSDLNEVVPNWTEAPENLSKVRFVQVATLPNGTTILFADDKEGVLYRSADGAADQWVVLPAGFSDVSSGDRWFLTLEDAYLQSGNWNGRFPDNYEVS